MALKDLMRIAKKAKQNRVSLLLKIDLFLYKEHVALAKGEITERDVRLQEATIEKQIAEMKLERWKKRVKHSRSEFFHPSTLASCARETVYARLKAPTNQMVGFTSEDVGRTLRVFQNGDSFHTRMQVLMIRMGLCRLKDIEVPFEIGDRQGTCDAIATIDGKRYVVDFKSASENSFMWTKRSGGNNEKYLAQIRMYMKEFGINEGFILYENKNNQDLYETLCILKKEHVIQIEDRLNYLRRHIRKKKLPEREGEGLSKFPCKVCAFSDICLVHKERSNQWLRKLKSKPKRTLF